MLAQAEEKRRDQVVLLHGLARSPRSLKRIEKTLKREGYQVTNIGYPSRKFSLPRLSELVREKILASSKDIQRIHFVTHSMGGVLLRYLQKHNPIENIGRAVMLSPPNQGSEIVDVLGDLLLYEWINGPAGLQLGTSDNGLISQLGAVDFDLGVITGDRSVNWILSLMIPGKNDGKVSIESAKVDGMADFKVVHATHPFIMRNKAVIQDIIRFLEFGKFAPS